MGPCHLAVLSWFLTLLRVIGPVVFVVSVDVLFPFLAGYRLWCLGYFGVSLSQWFL